MNLERRDHLLQSTSSDDDEHDDNDDLITFQIDTKAITFHYSQLSQFSKKVRNGYLYTDAVKHFPSEFHNLQQQYKINSDNIVYFFQLLQMSFNFEESVVLTYEQCIDLFKISDFLQVDKLPKKIKKYIKVKKGTDVNFIIQIILHELEDSEFQISQQMEDVLTTKIDDCFKNENFSNLPISVIFRIIQKSATKQMSTDSLYKFIKRSIGKFYILLQFVDLKKLSDENLADVCETYSNGDEKTRQLFEYMKCNLMLVKELIEDRRKLRNDADESVRSRDQIEIEKNRLQEKLVETEAERDALLTKVKELKSQNDRLQGELNDSENSKSQLEKEKSQLCKQLADLEKERSQTKGKIVASVKNGLVFNAKIYLQMGDSAINTTRSKYIVSTSSSSEIGEAEYAKGLPITSLEQTTVDFGAKAGRYYVRAIVVDAKGRAVELLSNPVTTSGRTIEYGYAGKEEIVTLAKGRYKLEAWGAAGGRAAGANDDGTKTNGLGGLGGYSKGCLTLAESNELHIFVGGAGRTAASENGKETEGGFPDGGGTKTGNQKEHTTVPGTGGGSTSIRICSNSLYARVIVAGGGGGAGGDYYDNHGGFGGGETGGNCYYRSRIKDRGAGTQTGSSPGFGAGSDGVAGSFGKGADGLFRSCSNSGGGGGGGWYGGGGGGYGGHCTSSSGGGGSGWIFTESSLNRWRSGDSTNSGKFLLNASHYLTDASTASGSESFPKANENGTETGHAGNGYAKITPE